MAISVVVESRRVTAGAQIRWNLYVTHGMQQLGQGANLGAIGVDLVWLFAWAVALLIAAGRVFRWD